MYSDVVTLFNYHEATDAWYPSVITGVDVGSTSQHGHTPKAGFTNEDEVIILIQCTAAKKVTTSAGVKSYAGPKEYADISNPAEAYTFAPETDFIYVGEWPSLDAIPASGDDVGDMGLYHEMNDSYDDVYMVSSVSFYGLIPHFEVGGR